MNIRIIIPTYNEAGNIAPFVERVLEVLPNAQILVVDDSSPDGTASIVRDIASHDPRVSLLLRTAKNGLGRAYLHAFSETLKDPSITHVVMMDADFSHDPMYLTEMVHQAQTHDVVLGSRYVKGGGTEGWEPWRKALSNFGNLYCRAITWMPVHDATGGYNLISTEQLRKIDLAALDSSGYAFQMELKYMLWKSGARFAEVPIIFKNRREGESKISNHIIREGILAPWKMILKK